jgi:hypothetical protein
VMWVVAVAAVAVWGSGFLLLWPAREAALVAAPAATPTTTPETAHATTPAAPIEPSPLVPEEEPPALPTFAVSDGVSLVLVSPKALAVAFHEASYRDATALRPLGRCRTCRNRTKFTPPLPRNRDLWYIVTDTRGRDTPATSAADIVLPRGETVLAPVSGTVTRVKRYRLYSSYRDVRVEIRPQGVPDRRVVLIHLAGVHLGRGDHVEASTTRIGEVRRFGFESQVDRYVRGRHPHVHMEVKDPAKAPPKGPPR